jgi:transglutaminase-like putative cysteine protease
VVITAKLLRGQPEEVPKYWRGATFTLLTRYGWTADTNQQGLVNRSRQVDEPWRPIDGGFVRPNHRSAARLEVLLTDRHAQHLFLPAETNRIQFNCLAWPNIDGNFRLSRNDTGRIRYLLSLNAPGDRLRKMPRTPGPDHLYLHPRRIPKSAVQWNERARQSFPPAADQAAKVRRLRDYVQNAREYVLPGEDGAADNLRGFFEGQGGGHCEYFATALTILLRLNDIPCRMVSGYLAHEWNDAGTELTIRSSHAHAWVEVWDAARGWYTVDPTPTVAGAGDAGESLLARAQDWLRRAWTAVTSFDGKARDAALAWSKQRLVALLTFTRDHPGWTALLAAGLLALRRLLRARRRRHVDPAVRAYLGVLTGLKLARRPGETPRQLLARVDLPPAHRQRLAEATRRHEAARYADPATPSGRR